MSVATAIERAPLAREAFLAYVAAGFSEHQALYLTGVALIDADGEGRRIRHSHGMPMSSDEMTTRTSAELQAQRECEKRGA